MAFRGPFNPGATWRRRTPAGLILLLGLAALGAFPTGAGAQEQEVRLGVEASRRERLKLILEELNPVQGATGTDAARVRGVVANDLSMTDFFDILPAPAGATLGRPPDASGDGSDGVFPGARMVAGGAVRMDGDNLALDGWLKEYPSLRVILSRTYRARPEWFRETAHRFSDDIVLYLTGEEGISRTRIAFVSEQGGAKELHVIDYDGENLRQITRDRSIALSPAWSADGSRLAFVSFRRGDPDLYQVSLASGEITLLSGRPGPDMAPAFSRDGRRLAYAATIDGNSELFTADANGRNPRRITSNRAIESAVCWSPTGREICFTSDRSGGPQLYVADGEGGNVRRLTFEGKWNDSPDWSPDGLRIVYVSRGPDGFKVWTIGVDGSGATRITGGPGTDENPKWSPDGRKIVFSSTREGRRALYTMNADGTGVRRLTFLAGECSGTSWSARLPR